MKKLFKSALAGIAPTVLVLAQFASVGSASQPETFTTEAGETGPGFSGGDEPGRIGMFAWVRTNSGQRTRPVGRKMPNPFGLHDIYGNVSEWCNDFFVTDHRPEAGEVNPRGPAEGTMRVVRGGSWHSSHEEANSYARKGAEPGYADVCIAGYDEYGFRIVRPAKVSK